MSDHVDTQESIPKRSKQLIVGLSRSATKVTTVADAVKKSYTDLPTSEKAVGIEESKALTEAREQMTNRLLLYRELHLPLSITMVNDLVRTLDYFKRDFKEFKPVLCFVQKQVKEAAERANFVHKLYITLSEDLVKLGEDAEQALKLANLAAQENLKSAVRIEKIAKRVGMGGTGVGAGVVVAGFALACGLTGPGGLLFAPLLALPAFVASSTVGVVGASTTAIAASVLKDQSNQKQIIAGVLKESSQVYETVLVGALNEFAECMKGCAEFFQDIDNQLDNINQNMSDLNDALEDFSEISLRGLYDVIRGQSDDLRKACALYLTHTCETKVAIGVLDRFGNENYRSYIDEWYNRCSSQIKTMPSSANLLKKVVPHMKVLHR